MDGRDSQAWEMMEVHGYTCDVDILENMDGAKCSNLPK
jgi:hypothetical protein